MANSYPNQCIFEPELGPNLQFQLDEFKTSANVYASGKINLYGTCTDQIVRALKHLYKILVKFSIKETAPPPPPPPKPEQPIQPQRSMLTRKLALKSISTTHEPASGRISMQEPAPKPMPIVEQTAKPASTRKPRLKPAATSPAAPTMMTRRRLALLDTNRPIDERKTTTSGQIVKSQTENDIKSSNYCLFERLNYAN